MIQNKQLITNAVDSIGIYMRTDQTFCAKFPFKVKAYLANESAHI